jgi:hypothetical protein
MKTTVFVVAMCLSAFASAQGQSDATSQQHSKKARDEITVRGCVSKQSTDYILTQADVGNSYQLQGTKGLRFRNYLGQEVEVTGVESPSMSTSSDYLARSGSASPVTITVHSIKTIQKRCSGS